MTQSVPMYLSREKSDVAVSIGLLLLRVGFGGFLLTHGRGKVEMILRGEFGSFGDPIGIGPFASLILTAFAELVCAFMVIIGFGTRWFSVPIVIAMAVAAFVAHEGNPWTMAEGANLFFSGESKSWASKQPALMFLLAFLALIFTGGGRYAIDEMVASRKSRRRYR